MYQTDEMQPPVPILRSLAAGHDVFGLVELPLLDGDIDPDDVLPDYAARTDIQMSVERAYKPPLATRRMSRSRSPDFRVAH